MTSRASNGLVLAVEIPGSALPASSSIVATLVVENSSETDVGFVDYPRIRILDSSGTVVYDSVPPLGAGADLVVTGTTLGPDKEVTRTLRFVVPAPGEYTLAASMRVDNPFPSPATVHFASVLGRR